MITANCQRIGKIAKLHSVKGEILLIADNSFDKNFEKTKQIFLLVDELPVPFFISNIRLKSEVSAIIKFDGIDSAEEIEEYVGVEVLIPKKKGRKSKAESYKTNNIKDYKVIDSKHGEIGVAKTILNFQGNYLIQVFKDKKEILIPISDDIVERIDDYEKCVYLSIPDGLIHLSN
jgi:16S rRNA processing protein RimM